MKILIKVARDSVSMGDDCAAPNGLVFEVEQDLTLDDFCHLIIEDHYLPSIQGGEATWVLVFRNLPIAVFAQHWNHPKFLIDSSMAMSKLIYALVEQPNYHFWFEYKCQKDPEKIYKDLKHQSIKKN